MTFGKLRVQQVSKFTIYPTSEHEIRNKHFNRNSKREHDKWVAVYMVAECLKAWSITYQYKGAYASQIF